ncbi:DUF535 domain-containing protein [Sphingomonas panacisoli]|uniref:DUF535 domain-containing protein n=1 Tax=Sphingomonas panacisoli TaxID=1813879 RepID=A0A5B8LDG3_9SPHN|nr:DUF535 family protein [Sphingomonas panacisoli]QDZ06208.1 DUF535 domain-containing protein [Sphingomonas panacisoli]
MRQVAALLRRPGPALRLKRIAGRARKSGHASADASIPLKYVGDYLSLSLSPGERYRALAFHYGFLESTITGVRIEPGLVLWQSIDDEGKTHDVVLQPAWAAPMEGETELCFRLDGVRLFTLTFCIVQGGLVGSAEPAVIFVGGVQGIFFGKDRIRYAARKNQEIAPLAMLLLAIDAVAEMLGIATIVGTSDTAQAASQTSVDGRSTTIDYAALWRDMGGIDDGRGHYCVAVGQTSGAEKEVAGKNKARTRRRRLQRRAVRDAMIGMLAVALGRDAPAAAPARKPIADRDGDGARRRVTASGSATPVAATPSGPAVRISAR